MGTTTTEVIHMRSTLVVVVELATILIGKLIVIEVAMSMGVVVVQGVVVGIVLGGVIITGEIVLIVLKKVIAGVVALIIDGHPLTLVGVKCLCVCACMHACVCTCALFFCVLNNNHRVLRQPPSRKT